MKKKVIILVGSLSVISIIIIVVTVLQHPAPKPSSSPTPSPTNQPNIGTPGPQGSQELPSDLKYGQALTEISQQYPWYPKLPINTKDYQIVYDFDKQMFRIRIKSTPVTSDQAKTVTQNALDSLKNIGVQEPIKYYVLDANGNQL